VAVAEASLASVAGEALGARYEVVVHVDADALAADDEPGCVVEAAGAVAAETARRLACDASVVTLSTRNGRTVRVGRKTRTVQPALRRALSDRDRRCRFPGCEARRFLHAHHIEHWARGGTTNLENLVLLCSRHHRLVHEGGYGIDRRLRFYDPRGRPVPNAPPARRGDVERLRGHPAHPVIGPGTCVGGLGERLDLALAVDAMHGASASSVCCHAAFQRTISIPARPSCQA
jgi:5-methylcytosine-specific restriction endonuclease McrA